MTATATQALEAIRIDPVAFSREVLKFDPWSKQAEILRSVRDHKRTAVRSAHGVGKTAVAARSILWFLAAHPNSKVISTAPTWHQVKEQLWRELAVAYTAAGGFFDGQLDDTRLELAPDWFAVGLSTDRAERFSGHHAEHLGAESRTCRCRSRSGRRSESRSGRSRVRPRRRPTTRSGGRSLPASSSRPIPNGRA